MKIFNKYIAGALLLGSTALSFQSCSLDEYNPGGETVDEITSTPQGMETLVNQMYYWIRAKYYGREDPVLMMEGSTDLWQNIGSTYEYGMQLTRCVDLDGSRGQVAGVWDRAYDDINNANTIINRMEACSGLTTDQANDFEGEARFIRSYMYWWLCEFFGDIELRTQETTTAEFAAYRTPVEDIYDQIIIPDAQAAADKLPVSPYKGNVGRATKKAAKALLARVLLARAQYETEGSDKYKSFITAAKEAAMDLINNKYGVVTYDNSYDDIWKAKNNKSNTEFLWVNSFSSNETLDADTKPNRLHMYYTPILLGRPGIGSGSATTWEYPKESGFKMAPTYYFMSLWKDWDARYEADFQENFPAEEDNDWFIYDDYLEKFKLPEDIELAPITKGKTVLKFTKSSLSDDEEEEYALEGIATVDIDKLYKTESVNAYGGAPLRNCITNYGTVETTPEISSSYPRFRKFRIWDGDENGTILLKAANGQFGFADAPIMRYAEVPLIAAECCVRLGDAPGAIQIIKNHIRTPRVLKAGHNMSEALADVTEANLTGDNGIEWIMAERARELCGEYLRWFDLKRVYGPKGKFAETINGRNPAMGDANTAKGNARQEYNQLWPIPNTFLDVITNPTEFGQNPGYPAYSK